MVKRGSGGKPRNPQTKMLKRFSACPASSAFYVVFLHKLSRRTVSESGCQPSRFALRLGLAVAPSKLPERRRKAGHYRTHPSKGRDRHARARFFSHAPRACLCYRVLRGPLRSSPVARRFQPSAITSPIPSSSPNRTRAIGRMLEAAPASAGRGRRSAHPAARRRPGSSSPLRPADRGSA